jgi:hypothetical protein
VFDGVSSVISIEDAIYVKIKINEISRITAIRGSATPGGDGTGLLFAKTDAAAQDLSGNADSAINGFSINEIADTIPPSLINASIDLNNGMISIFASEILDSRPTAIIQSKISIFNTSLLSSSTVVIHSALVYFEDSLILNFKIIDGNNLHPLLIYNFEI